MIRRRDLLAGLGGAAMSFPRWAIGQAGSDRPLIAVLWPSSQDVEREFDIALRHGLKESGYVEGTNFTFAMRYGNGDRERLAARAAELAALKPAVIATATDGGITAVRAVAPEAPLVAIFANDPVALGLAQNFARPGGTLTGYSLSAGGDFLAGKRLALLKEAIPHLKRIGYLVDPLVRLRSGIDYLEVSQMPAAKLGLEFVPLPVRSADEIKAAFAAGVREGVDAFNVSPEPLFFSNRAEVTAQAIRTGKPSVTASVELVRAGILMGYATDFADLWRRMGTSIAKILSGTRPGDLPIEQPDKYVLAINLKTAKALGLTIPPTLLARADEVIE